MHQTVTVNGILTEIYLRHDSTRPRSDVIFVMVPGNPGLVDFYVDFLDHLFLKFKSQYDFLAVGHAGHGGAQLSTEQTVYNLSDQIQHKCDFLLALTSNSLSLPNSCGSNSRIVLMGHSIGSFICLKVQNRFLYRQEFHIQHIVHLFPTIRNLWDGLDAPIKLLILPGFRNVMANVGHWVPDWVFKTVAERALATESTPSFLAALIEKANHDLILNVLTLAKYESVEVVDIDSEIIESVTARGESMTWLYSHIDPYTPLTFPKELKEQFPNTNVFMAKDKRVKHAFCISDSMTVADQIHEILSAQDSLLLYHKTIQ